MQLCIKRFVLNTHIDRLGQNADAVRRVQSERGRVPTGNRVRRDERQLHFARITTQVYIHSWSALAKRELELVFSTLKSMYSSTRPEERKSHRELGTRP